MQRILLSLAVGFGLLIMLWTLNAFIAFIVFDRTTDVWFVLPTWLVADVCVIAILWWYNRINYVTGIGFVMAIGILSGLYLVPTDNNFPHTALEFNEHISTAHDDRYRYAQNLFFELEDRWSSPVRQYLIEPHKVFFIKSAEYFWNLPEGSYVDSNVQAHLYRNLLIESERFTPQEVRVEQHFCTNSPHGVVVLDTEVKKIYADLWAVDNFSDYQFGEYTTAPCDVLVGTPADL